VRPKGLVRSRHKCDIKLTTGPGISKVKMTWNKDIFTAIVYNIAIG